MKKFVSKTLSVLLAGLLVLLVGCNAQSEAKPESTDMVVSGESVVSDETVTSETEKPSSSETSKTEKDDKTTSSSKKETTSSKKQTSSTTGTSTHKHTYTKKVSKPTCTAMGYTIYTCSCGYSYRGDEKMALECDYAEWVTVTPATTMQQGLRQRKCKRCGNEEEEILVKKLVRSNVDPAVTIRQTWHRYQFELGSISLDDRRTWGETPIITVVDGDVMHVVYYDKNNKRVEFDARQSPHDDYLICYVIKDDGTWCSFYVGGFS